MRALNKVSIIYFFYRILFQIFNETIIDLAYRKYYYGTIQMLLSFTISKALRNIVNLSLSIGYENKASAPYMDENQPEENQIIHDEQQSS